MVDVRVDAAVGDEAEEVDAFAALERAMRAGFSKKEPSSIALLTRMRSWNSTRPEPIVRWPTSLLPICPGGSPTALARCLERRVREGPPEPVEVRRVGELDGVARPRPARSPSRRG